MVTLVTVTTTAISTWDKRRWSVTHSDVDASLDMSFSITTARDALRKVDLLELDKMLPH